MLTGALVIPLQSCGGQTAPLPADWTSPGIEVLASGVGEPGTLAVQQNSVWWINLQEGGVLQLPLLAPSPIQRVSGLSTPKSLALDGADLFWLDATGVVHCSLPICADRRSLTATDPSSNGLALDADRVYWIDRSHVLSCPRSGCDAGGPDVLAAGEDIFYTAIRPLALDEANIYWVRQGGVAVSIPKTGGAPRVVATGGPNYISGVAVDTSTIYWIAFDLRGSDFSGELLRAPIVGGATTVLDTFQGVAYDLAVDDQNVYFTANVGPADAAMANDGNNGIVKAVDKHGGASAAAAFLAQGEINPSSIAVDGAKVYWASSGPSGATGTIKRVDR